MALFYPVEYNKENDLWYGHYFYKHPTMDKNPMAIEAFRKGTCKRYYVHDTRGKSLPQNHPIHKFIEQANEQKMAYN